MRMIIFSIITTGVLLDVTDRAVAACQTLAQARALNPHSHLAYLVVGGAHCWFAGIPRHQSRKSEPIELSTENNAAKPLLTPERANLPAKSEPDIVATLSVRPHSPQYRIDDTFDVIGRDAGSLEVQLPLHAFKRRVLDAYARYVEIDETKPVQMALQTTTPPATSDAGHLMLVIRNLLAIIGIATTTVSVLMRCSRRRLSAPSAWRTSPSRADHYSLSRATHW